MPYEKLVDYMDKEEKLVNIEKYKMEKEANLAGTMTKTVALSICVKTRGQQ